MISGAARFTSSGVRLRLHRARGEGPSWLLVPGGPGLGSESLVELAEQIDVGEIWLVDLPGDGSNLSPPGAPTPPFSAWPDALVEAAHAVPRPVLVGHSTGGMYGLAVPALEAALAGLVLISSAPDARWRPTFFAMTQRHPLPAVDDATRAYAANPTIEALRALTIASAPWSFPPSSVDRGRALFGRLPYCGEAVAWSERAFDDVYEARWWPRTLPTSILSGADDLVVDQTLWHDPRFRGPNVAHHTLAGAGHFPWFEAPDAVRAALRELAARIG